MREISRQSASQSRSSKGGGTVAFIAPEVFEDNVARGQETKIDVYSYGLYITVNNMYMYLLNFYLKN